MYPDHILTNVVRNRTKRSTKVFREGEVMAYIVKSSEKTRKQGVDTETKVLLYLMNLRKDSESWLY